MTDLLIVFGLFGFCLFMAMIASYLWFIWGIYHYKFYPNVEAGVRSLALFAFLTTAQSVIYGLIAGGGNIDGLSLLIILSRIYSVHHEKKDEVSAAIAYPALPHALHLGTQGFPSRHLSS